MLPLDLESAFLAGDIQKELIRKGEIIDPEDCMIAGIALKSNEPLLTRNLKHFKRIPGLQVETY
jgi:predicted nucleic acid-binding protein